MRIMIAGTGSGCGKTTASLLVMAAFMLRNRTVAPCKVGPDYIDPGFHEAVCLRPSQNLDAFLTDPAHLPFLLQNDADVTVIEGVMGYYDGLDCEEMRASSWDVARATHTPVLLVVDASGGAASVAAQVRGFQTLREDSRIAGVLVNRVSGERHYQLIREAVARYTALPCAGYLTRSAAIAFPSRHLGLIPAGELADVRKRLFAAAGEALQTLDLSLIERIASAAPPLPSPALRFPRRVAYRLGVARDEAFSFYYDANFRVLREMGFSLEFFSPLHDRALPDGLDGLYLGGGFPEVFADALSANESMRASILRALRGSLRAYAECGGMMYLTQSIDGAPMVGYLPARCEMTDRLQRFGYVHIQDRTGLRFPAHEFHHSRLIPTDSAAFAYRVTKASDPSRSWSCGLERGHTLAAYAHLHFLSHPELAARLWPEKEVQA